MNLNFSKHARARMQQRSIPPIVVDWLVDFGHCEYGHDGTRTYFFDKASRREFKSYAGPVFGSVNEFLNVYAVVSVDSQVITVAVRQERRKRQ